MPFPSVSSAFSMQTANLHPFDLPIQRILVDLETRLPPWMKLVSQSQSHEQQSNQVPSAFARLSQEITAFADLISPTAKEKKVRETIIERLQMEVRKIWSHAKVIPIGSYAQGLYTSSRSPCPRLFDISHSVPVMALMRTVLLGLRANSSDMDLFVEVGDARQSPEQCLEVLYSHLENRRLFAPGTLTIVRTARVPIIKYIDSQGSGPHLLTHCTPSHSPPLSLSPFPSPSIPLSPLPFYPNLTLGIQVDVSLNNISATSSTNFITHHLTHQPLLKPLTILLKQWLFQRQMNEVYSRGGLSSYALFLLVLTIVHQTQPTTSFPKEEFLGRWLWEFLRRWSECEAFTKIVRPLKGELQKDWRDFYTPYGLCMSRSVPLWVFMLGVLFLWLTMLYMSPCN